MQSLILLTLTFTFLLLTFNLPPARAQTNNCLAGSAATALAQGGLISAPSINSFSSFGGTTSGACVINPIAAFAPFKIPSFNDLKSLYFDQAKASSTLLKQTTAGPAAASNIPFNSTNNLYDIKGDLNLSGANPGSGSGIVFVEGNLNITGDYCYATTCSGPVTGASGTVFMVSGNVNIAQTVTRIDAVIIGAGFVCTAADFSSGSPVCPSVNVLTSQLIINGSLISIDQDETHTCPASCPIRFRRTLADNSQPSEKINHQVKYLVILRNTVALTLQRWSEISGPYVLPPTLPPLPSPTPTPVFSPTPTPVPTVTPTPTPTPITCSFSGPTSVSASQTATYTSTSTGNITSYSWSGSPGSPRTSIANPYNWTAPSTSGTYSISLTVGNGSSYQSCGNSVTVTAPCPVYYRDYDADGYGDPARTTASCSGAPSGYVSNNSDCDDFNSNVHPGQTTYFSTPIVDSGGTSGKNGSFDYDCSGSNDPNPWYNCVTTIASSAPLCQAGFPGQSGYVNNVPGCGVSAAYRSCWKVAYSCPQYATGAMTCQNNPCFDSGGPYYITWENDSMIPLACR